MFRKKIKRIFATTSILIASLCLIACSDNQLNTLVSEVQDTVSGDNSVSTSTSANKEDAIPVIDTITYIPSTSDSSEPHSDYVWIDYSNSDQGYIMVKYLGSHTGKVKFQITGPDQLTYTFNLSADEDFQTFPLTGGSGTYTLNTFEQDSGTTYYTVDSISIDVTLESELLPYLYPNQFVNYTQASKAVALSIEASTDIYSEIDKIASIYTLVMDTLDYDQAQAELISAGGLVDYIPDLDTVIEAESGICFDYASLMVAMLRIQEMPAKLVIGYAGEAYHAWINVYTEENGWINEIIYFDGEEWALMDPTFADNADNNSAINDFIGDGTNYTEKYVY